MTIQEQGATGNKSNRIRAFRRRLLLVCVVMPAWIIAAIADIAVATCESFRSAYPWMRADFIRIWRGL